MVIKRASSLFSEDEQSALRRAVHEAEAKTSGEVVVAVASVSGRYDRAEDIVGMLVGLGALCALWIFGQRIVPGSGEWASGSTVALGLLQLVLIVVAGVVAGSAVASFFPVLGLPFISAKEKQEEVERRAAECFYRYGVGRSVGATGILIYISLYERMVAVKGDQAISAKIAEAEWQDVCRAILDGFKDGQPCRGICEGLTKCGDHLARHFPKQEGDVNELADAVHFID